MSWDTFLQMYAVGQGLSIFLCYLEQMHVFEMNPEEQYTFFYIHVIVVAGVYVIGAPMTPFQ